jgi:hypothetical protein
MSHTLTVIACHPSGFEVHLQVPSLDILETTIADLLQRGYRPTSGAGDGWTRTPEGLPLCPKHRVVMPTREKQGDTWHSHQITDQRTGELLYCRGYPGPSSPGWEIPG